MSRETTSADLYLHDAKNYLDESSPALGGDVETRRLWHAVLYLTRAVEELCVEVRKKDETILSLANRCHAQSEALSRKAEKPDHTIREQ